MSRPYTRFPVQHESKLYFIANRAIWIHSDGNTSKIASFKDSVSGLKISPCGKYLSFVSAEESLGDVYKLDLASGRIERKSYFGDALMVNIAFYQDEIIIKSVVDVIMDENALWSIKDKPERLPYASTRSMARSGDTVVIQRFGWKPYLHGKYQGGLIGRLCKVVGDQLEALDFPGYNCHSPLFVGGRLFFLSDLNDMQNLYEYDLQNNTYLQKTFHRDFGVRDISGYGNKILYTAGGLIHEYDIALNTTMTIPVTILESAHDDTIQEVKIEDVSHASTNDSCDRLAFCVRGRVISSFEGGFVQYANKLHHRKAIFLSDTELLCIRETLAGSIFDVYECNTNELLKSATLNTWVVRDIKSFDKDKLIVETMKGSIYYVDLQNNLSTLIVDGAMCGGFDISPDRKWVVYSMTGNKQDPSFENLNLCLYLYNFETNTHHKITDGVGDWSPCFSSDGQYIYFLSNCDIVIGSGNFEFFYMCYFKKNVRICAMKVNHDVGDPFNPLQSDTIADIRLNELICLKSEIAAGPYKSISVIDGSRLLLEESTTGEVSRAPSAMSLYSVDIKTGVKTKIADGSSHNLSPNGKAVVVDSHDGALYGTIGSDLGSVDVGGVLHINHKEEQQVVFDEAWLQMKERFWNLHPDYLDWDQLKQKYQALLQYVNSKDELYAVLEEMGGELRTSHVDFMPHTPNRPTYQGHLGASFRWNDGYEITEIDQTEDYKGFKLSPLLKSTPIMKIGDVILSISGEVCEQSRPIEYYLRHVKGNTISMTYRRDGKVATIKVNPMRNTDAITYRKWSNENLDYVHAKSGGKIGYVHIPTMGADGLAEFMSLYSREVRRNGLIVDVRNNPGGYVMETVMNYIGNHQIGSAVEKGEVVNELGCPNQGRLVILCNGSSRSGGDAVPHECKLKKIGTVIGWHTGGALVGVSGAPAMLDRTSLNVPQLALYYADIGDYIENHGAEPDILVEPRKFLTDEDPQLKKAVEFLLEQGVETSVTEEILKKFLPNPVN